MEKIVEKRSNEKPKKIVKLVLNIIFWVFIIGLAAIWLTDSIKVYNKEQPVFCLTKKTHTYDDGTVEECVGLGYKVYYYNRTSLNGREFVPFFIGIKE